jgi:hypothetical protein
MKNIGLTSIAAMALLGTIDKATAIEMNQQNNATTAAATINKAAVSKPVAVQTLSNQTVNQTVTNGMNKSKKTNATTLTNVSK